MLTRVLAPTGHMLERTGVTAKVGAENLYPQVLDAVVEHLARAPAVTPQGQGLLRDGLHRLRLLVEEAGATLDSDEGADRERLQTLGRRLGRAESAMGDALPGPH